MTSIEEVRQNNAGFEDLYRVTKLLIDEREEQIKQLFLQLEEAKGQRAKETENRSIGDKQEVQLIEQINFFKREINSMERDFAAIRERADKAIDAYQLVMDELSEEGIAVIGQYPSLDTAMEELATWTYAVKDRIPKAKGLGEQ